MSDEVIKIFNKFISSLDFTTISNFAINNYKTIFYIVVAIIILKWLKEILLIFSLCLLLVVINDEKLQNKAIKTIKKIIHKT